MTEGARGAGVVRVLVVDDHDLFRTGLASLLSAAPDIDVVAQASGGRMGVRLAGELRPDVIVMDHRMPDLEGPDAIRLIVERDPTARVLAMTVASDEATVAAAVSAGACGFLTKDAPIDGVLDAVRAAARGITWLSPRAAEVIFERVRGQATQNPTESADLERLSSRELEVLRLVARGEDNAAIADALGISPRTVKNHVSNILAKLGIPNRVQAAVFAARSGLL